MFKSLEKDKHRPAVCIILHSFDAQADCICDRTSQKKGR